MTMDDWVLHHEVAAFLAQEAELLDQSDFKAWVELFEDDGIYWVPASPKQTDMKTQVSVMLEDKALLELRVTRLSHPHAYSIEPHPATTHLIGNVTVSADDKLIYVKSKLIVEQIREDKQTRWSGSAMHHLRRGDTGFGIVLKRIDLIQAGNIFPVLSIPL